MNYSNVLHQPFSEASEIFQVESFIELLFDPIRMGRSMMMKLSASAYVARSQ